MVAPPQRTPHVNSPALQDFPTDLHAIASCHRLTGEPTPRILPGASVLPEVGFPPSHGGYPAARLGVVGPPRGAGLGPNYLGGDQSEWAST